MAALILINIGLAKFASAIPLNDYEFLVNKKPTKAPAKKAIKRKGCTYGLKSGGCCGASA